MILVKPSFEILTIHGVTEGELGEQSLKLIELAGRTCYKSGEAVTLDSASAFTQMILKRGHESVIEHSAMIVRFICDRGVTHELVRHRLCSFSQESTRYVNYKGGCTFVIPPWLAINEGEFDSKLCWQNYSVEELEDYYKLSAEELWISAMAGAEMDYQSLLGQDWSPQQARSVLPNSTKTEIVVTANFREWRHIFKLRCSKAAHPQMREIMIPLHKKCKELISVIFDDIEY